MTNVDLYDLVDYIAFLRNVPEREKNLFYLDCMINTLGTDGTNTSPIYELMRDPLSVDSNQRVYIPSPVMLVEDLNVYYVFRSLFHELKRLYLLKQYKGFYLLTENLHNLPYKILDNNLKLPFKPLIKGLKPYWRRFNREFLREFVEANKNLP